MPDVAVLVAVQPYPVPGSWVDPEVRSAFAPTRLITTRARDRLSEMLGALPRGTPELRLRSLTSVVLATSLERAGLAWRVFDPGAASLGHWRKELERLRADPPRVVAISSTFVADAYWLGNLCALVRRSLPGSHIVVGGHAYATDTKYFLSLDADVLCVGDGEVRLPQIVAALRDRKPLDAIPGLYLRASTGRLRHTGHAEPLPLDDLPPPDWDLALRIEPPMDPRHHPNEYCVETQRGCVFKCEFCTYRTIAAPELSQVEHAVRALRRHAGHRGKIFLIDATATTPRDRWIRILQRLIELGGAPLPTSCYARVSDLDDEMCELMARAGIRGVQIGQESGDQRMLNVMRKGTRVDQVAPAIAALGRHGIQAQLSMVFGFPGETRQSIAATRELIRTVNDGHESCPVVRHIGLNVFDIQNFAAIGQREPFRERTRYTYTELPITPAEAAGVVLDTSLEVSRISQAPIVRALWGSELWPLWDGRIGGFDAMSFFRWAKAIDRAVGIFVEAELGEKRPNRQELRRLREQILDGVAQEHRHPSRLRWAAHKVKNRAAWKLLDLWAHEGAGRVDPLTRGFIGFEVARATGSASDVVHAVKTGRYPNLGVVKASMDSSSAEEARGLVDLAAATGRKRLKRVS